MLEKKVVLDLCKRNLPMYFALIALNWLIVVSTIVLAVRVDNILVYLISLFIIASRQHGLFVVLHDQVHYGISKNKIFGDLVANLFCGYPLGINTNRYREEHLPHHRYPNSHKDPYWHSMNTLKGWSQPQTKSGFIIVLLKDLFGLNADNAKLIWPWHVLSNHFSLEKRKGIPPLSLIERVSLYFLFSMVACATFYFELYIPIILWFCAQFFVLNVYIRLRAMGEHPFYELKDHSKSTQMAFSNTVKPGFFESFFFAPFDSGHHTVHHLYPGLPTYNLKRAHQLLLECKEYREKVDVYDGYFLGKKTIFKMICGENQRRVNPSQNQYSV